MDPLKILLDSKKAEIKELKDVRKKARKIGNDYKAERLDYEISEIEAFVNRFSPSKMEPRRVGDVVINYKLYSRFMKKLKGFVITEEVSNEGLVIKYYKDSHQGELFLNDLAHFFDPGSVFPEGKLQETSLI